MKTKPAWILAAVSAAALICSAARADDSDRHLAKAIADAKVSLKEAIHVAEKQGNGQATSAEFEFSRGDPAYYEVKVLSNDGQKLTRYDLNPNTGKVKEVSDEKFEKLFTRIKPSAIRGAPTSLTHAITAAEQRAGGKAIAADVDRDGDQVQYTVKVVKADGTSEKVKVNGSDGKVASVK